MWTAPSSCGIDNASANVKTIETILLKELNLKSLLVSKDKKRCYRFFPFHQTPKKLKIETKAATRVAQWKKMFLKISQYSQENICVGVSF